MWEKTEKVERGFWGSSCLCAKLFGRKKFGKWMREVKSGVFFKKNKILILLFF